MKKKISSLLVFALVLTLLVPAFAFAAVPSDVKGTNYEEAVAELVALGVINGYPDGTYRPDQPIGRAEFAKIVAYASGYAKAAELLGPQNTQFKDVNAKNYGWASGYIAVGANKGYFKGYTDGTFKPAKQVTYAEVLTVLMRILGYNDNLVGSWPSDYIIQATTLGVTDGINITANGLATRGAVAQLTTVTLDQNMVSYDKDLGDFTELMKNDKPVVLLSKAFESSLQQAVVFSSTLGGDNKDQLTLRYKVVSKDNSGNEVVSYENKTFTAKDLYIAGEKTLAQLLGHNVEVLVSGSSVKFMKDAQSAGDVVTGDVSSTSVSGSVYKVTVGGTEYTLDSNVVIYYNDEKVDLTSANVNALVDATVTLFKDGNVRFVNATEYAGTNLVVTSLSTLTTSGNASISADVYQGNSVTLRVDKNTKFFLDGKEAKYGDLAKGNIVNVIGTAPVKTLYAFSESFKGIPSKVNYSKHVVTVDSKNYDLVGYAEHQTLTIDGKTEYTFYLNGKGQVAKVEAVTGGTGTVTGFLAQKDHYQVVGDNGRLQDKYEFIVVTPDGKVTTLTTNSAKFTSAANGTITKFTEDDGTYDDTTSFLSFAGAVKKVNKVEGTKVTFDDNSVVYLSSSVVIYNADGYDPTDADAADVKVADVKALEGSTIVFSKDENNFYVNYVIIKTPGTPSADQLDDRFGIVTDKETVVTADGTSYNLYLDNEDVATAVYKGLYDRVATYELVNLTDSATSDKYGQYDDQKNVTGKGTLSGLDTSKKTFALSTKTGTFLYNSNTTVYLVDDQRDNKSVSLGVLSDLEDANGNAGYQVALVFGDEIQTNLFEVKAIAIYHDYNE